MIVKADATIQYQRVIDVLDMMGQSRDYSTRTGDPADCEVAAAEYRVSLTATRLKRLGPLFGVGGVILCICGVLVYFVYSAMQEPPPKTKKVITQVNIIRPPPPPPPPEDMPEPELEEEVEVIEQEDMRAGARSGGHP